MVKLLAQKTKQLIFWRPFLLNIVSNLNLPEYLISNAFYNKIRDPVLKAIVKYKDHPSIKAIERVSKSKDLFEFSNMQKKKIFQEIVDLDASNACQDTDVPTKTIKENADIFTDFVHHSNNASINNGDFPSFLKLPNVIPVFKKDCKNSKDNYRPINILKIYPEYTKEFCSNKQEHLRIIFFQNFIADLEKVLLALSKKWKPAVDKGKSFGALLTDLSKAFDCLPHELLIAKLHSYGFNLNALRLIRSYLSNKRQRTKINESYSSCEEILFGVPQGSTLRPLLFNIFMCDLFFIVDKVNLCRW